MYAAKRICVQTSAFTPEQDRISVTVTRGGKPLQDLNCEHISAIEVRVMSWRKANHIHGWFVDNVQHGQDDCGIYLVREHVLRALRATCQSVIEASRLVDGTITGDTIRSSENPTPVEQRRTGPVIEDPRVARRLLPTRSGFFFGGLAYDEAYLNHVIETRDWVTRMLSDLEAASLPTDICYSSSW